MNKRLRSVQQPESAAAASPGTLGNSWIQRPSVRYPWPVSDRFSRFPAALASHARLARLGPSRVPALLAHPNWTSPAPTVIWLHGRTVSKELDPGRYLRWIRAGLAACAIDLPGHGERLDENLHSPGRTLEVMNQVIPEIDEVVAALAHPPLAELAGTGELFDRRRLAIGGMSGGGMAVLRRLCDPHPFVCAVVEGSTGALERLFYPDASRPRQGAPAREQITRFDPIRHLEGWRAIPLLVLHSRADQVVPYAGMDGFVQALRAHYASRGAATDLLRAVVWDETGAPHEHNGFGRFSNEAKNTQTEFFRSHLRPGGP